MDQKRLFLAIAVSLAILLGFQMLMPKPPPKPAQAPQAASETTPTPGPTSAGVAAPGAPVAPAGPTAAARDAAAAAAGVPRLKITAPSVEGSVNLQGARIDELVLRGYRETIARDSPLVQLLAPRSEPNPYYVQFGWTAAPGEPAALPGPDTLWTSSAQQLVPGSPVTLTWNNGAGLTFELELAIDDNYMFTVTQHVRNATATPVALFPWSRIRRDYKPQVAGYYILFEGMLGVAGGTLQEVGYDKAKTEGERRGGVAFDSTGAGGWGGFTDKYWLTALIPDQAVPSTVSFRHIYDNGDRYQVDYVTHEAITAEPGGEASLTSRLFAGAKVVRLLDAYQSRYGIPNFDKAVDFGWFYFLTKPIFYALDWLNELIGNFGLAILVFTVFVKLLFFPLANKSYKSMSKMKLLGPKMQALRERFKDEPQRMQQEMMALYRTEKVNPASGCLPMVIQIPVFFSLYKVIFVTIEMRHAPFYGWIHDLSAVDPTNMFNLFGLLPFNPVTIAPFLHLGAWPLIMGCTMFLQQRLNPPPPDPVQARVFQFMPLIFTFMLANFPAGLVIYWSWNNTLSIAQQWLIMRRTRLATSRAVRT